MLLKSKITDFLHGSEAWHMEHYGKFSSSQIYKLAGKEGFGETGMSYIRTRVFESISGQSSQQEFLTEATASGQAEELIGLQAYANRYGIKWMMVQKMIRGENELVVSTPDAIQLKEDMGDHFLAETNEIKCLQPERHMRAIECETPQDVKKWEPKFYWQKIDQILVGDCLTGNLIFFHPALPVDNGGLHSIKFSKTQRTTSAAGKLEFPIAADMAFLKGRKELAIAEFHKIKNKLLDTI